MLPTAMGVLYIMHGYFDVVNVNGLHINGEGTLGDIKDFNVKEE